MYKIQQKCVLDEIIETEEDYVTALNRIVSGYMTEIIESKTNLHLPEDLTVEKIKILFSNIKDIFNWHHW